MLHHEARGSGPAVLFVHAGSPTRACGRRWPTRWHGTTASSRRTCAASGAARSSRALSHRDDLIALLDGLGVDRAAVVAASMGGAITLEVALHAPERISALALLDSAVDDALGWSDAMEAYGAAEEAAFEAGDLDEVVELGLRMWVDGHGRASPSIPRCADLVATMYRDSLAGPGRRRRRGGRG